MTRIAPAAWVRTGGEDIACFGEARPQNVSHMARAWIALLTLCRRPQQDAHYIDEQESDSGIEQCLADILPDAERGADH
jgi:hypothetical protein